MMSFDQCFSKSLSEDFDVMELVSSRLPLPKNWSQNVKMSVLHVISLARVAVVHARCLAVNSPDARMRLAGDLQGSLDEISLLE